MMCLTRANPAARGSHLLNEQVNLQFLHNRAGFNQIFKARTEMFCVFQEEFLQRGWWQRGLAQAWAELRTPALSWGAGADTHWGFLLQPGLN